jgi:hypothetical protein
MANNQAVAVGDQQDQAAGDRPGTQQSRNLWDFLIVAVVVLAIVGLTIGLIEEYPHAPRTVEAILGIVIPAFAAAFGIAAGYAGGHVSGQARGRQLGKQEVKGPVLQRLQGLNPPAQAVNTIRTVAESPAGSNRLFLNSNFAHNPVDLGTADDLDFAAKIKDLQDYVAGL